MGRRGGREHSSNIGRGKKKKGKEIIIYVSILAHSKRQVGGKGKNEWEKRRGGEEGG